MGKNFVKELEAELKAIREGKSAVEPYTGREGTEIVFNVKLSLSKHDFRKLRLKAKKRRVPVPELVQEAVQKLAD